MNKAKLFNLPVRLDEHAFESIFSEHYPKVYAILFRLTGNRFEADELAAETFWRLWEQPPAQNENLGGWLYRVASRLGYNMMRSNQRRLSYEEKAGREIFENHALGDPAEETEIAAERERVREVLSRMSHREVQVLILRHSGLSYKEIAAAVDAAPSSIGTLLARAEDRFEKLYRGDEKDAPEN